MNLDSLGYIIEKKQSTSTKYSKVVTLDSNCLQYTLDNLREKSEYTFAVFAENAVGVSPPATTDSVVLNANASKYTKVIRPLNNRIELFPIFNSCSLATNWTVGNSSDFEQHDGDRMGYP